MIRNVFIAKILPVTIIFAQQNGIPCLMIMVITDPDRMVNYKPFNSFPLLTGKLLNNIYSLHHCKTLIDSFV